MNIRGQLAMMPEKEMCFCHGGEKHWHAYEAVFNGEEWLPVTSQAGIDLLRALREEYGTVGQEVRDR